LGQNILKTLFFLRYVAMGILTSDYVSISSISSYSATLTGACATVTRKWVIVDGVVGLMSCCPIHEFGFCL